MSRARPIPLLLGNHPPHGCQGAGVEAGALSSPFPPKAPPYWAREKQAHHVYLHGKLTGGKEEAPPGGRERKNGSVYGHQFQVGHLVGEDTQAALEKIKSTSISFTDFLKMYFYKFIMKRSMTK